MQLHEKPMQSRRTLDVLEPSCFSKTTRLNHMKLSDWLMKRREKLAIAMKNVNTSELFVN
jgi:hypothetical protein